MCTKPVENKIKPIIEMYSIVITTTDAIDGYHITEYIDVVRSNIVLNRELALPDLFNGGSDKYRNQLNNIYNSAMQQIRLKGVGLGADAIVGLQTDFEEISGKGKSVFVVTMFGTAVKLDRPVSVSNAKREKKTTFYTLRQHQLSLQLRQQMDDERYMPGDDDWDNISTYSLYELAPQLYHRYLVLSNELVSSTTMAEKTLMLDRFPVFLQNMPYDDAAAVVYGDITTAPLSTSKLVQESYLFHPARIAGLLQPENKHFIISILDSDKECYNESDLEDMRKIEHYLDTLPDTGYYKTGRGKLFSKTGTLLVCERGHMSAVELGGHCTETMEHGLGICNLNVKGLTEDEVKAISVFKQKIEVLSSLIGEK